MVPGVGERYPSGDGRSPVGEGPSFGKLQQFAKLPDRLPRRPGEADMNILRRLFGVSGSTERPPTVAAQPMPERLACIREKLDRLRSIDRGYQVFGAKGHRYRERPVLAARGIEDLERALGVALPEELRDFIKHVHSGGPGPGWDFGINFATAKPEFAVRPFPYGTETAQDILARRETDRRALLPLFPDTDPDDDWPPSWGFLALTDLGCDSYAGIVITGEQRGVIWACADSGWVPQHAGRAQLDFLDWYESWLDAGLASRSEASGFEDR